MDKSVIFARPRHEYHSYSDLWNLASAAGFPVIYIDEIDAGNPDKCYIFSSPDASISFDNPKAKIISWLIEWYTDYEKQNGVSEVWQPDAYFAKKIGARYVPIGSNKGIGADPEQKQPYDVAHLMYTNGRRGHIVGEMNRANLKVSESAWGEERTKRLSQTKSMVHIHQHENVPALAPLRVAIAAAHKMPVFSETFWQLPHIPDGIIFSADYDKVVPTIQRELRRGERLRVYGNALHELLCDYFEFGKTVMGSV